MEDSLKALEVEASAKGEAVSAQARYNVYLKSYIDLLAKSNGAVQKGMPIERQRIKQLKEAEKALKEEEEAEKTRVVATQFNRHNGVPPAASFAFAKLESKRYLFASFAARQNLVRAERG